ncbi:MAG: hypothetical protein ACPGVG_13060 [Mycobacterium sp.]
MVTTKEIEMVSLERWRRKRPKEAPRKMTWRLAHDGDCHIYSLSRVCTCGLLHALLIATDNDRAELPTYATDSAKHWRSLDALEQAELAVPKPPTK